MQKKPANLENGQFHAQGSGRGGQRSILAAQKKDCGKRNWQVVTHYPSDLPKQGFSPHE